MSSSSDESSSSSSSDSSSSSSDDNRKRKASKKQKRTKEKKHKKQKKSKKQHKTKRAAKRPKVATVQIAPKIDAAIDDDEAAFGPALPPQLTKNNAQTPSVIGPVLPSKLVKNKKMVSSVPTNEPNAADSTDDDDGDGLAHFGPLPQVDKNLTANEIEREQRALELKIAAMEGRGLNQTDTDLKSREEWMLELPDVGLRTGLAGLSNMKRTFYAGKEKPDFSDRSSWTKTPQSQDAKQSKPTTSKTSVQALRSQAEEKYERERDAEQERMAKKHKKKHKREESLVDLHQKQLKKEQRRKEKELAASGLKPERRPFSRDVDLKLNKIDSNQTKQIVDKAKILNTKFSSGKAKYL